MAEENDERTEQATQQRREEFRKRGDVAQTKELGTFLLLFGSAIVIWSLGKFFLKQVSEMFEIGLTKFVVTAAREGDWTAAVQFAATKGFMLGAPILAIAGTLAIASTVLQVGILNNEEALQFNFERMNPISGFKRIFSLRSVIEGIKATAKVSIILFIVGSIVKKEILFVPHLTEMNVHQLMSYMGDVALHLITATAVFMAVLSVFDYGYNWWDLERRMRMTKQEIKEEHKNREGDPLIKARVRRMQREIANRKMMKEVPKADVIITNPTHIAVALKYEKDYPAPRVIAKGAGVIADKIKELAKENRIPIVENKPLARSIYKTLKIGQWIPRELFNAVAEVLAYVYRLKRKAVR